MTRTEARAAGLKHYDEGRRACPLQHVPVKRLVSSGICIQCARIFARERRRQNPDKFTAICKEWRQQNPDKVKAVNARRDPEKLRQSIARWRKENPEKHAAEIANRDKEKAKESRKRRQALQPKKLRQIIDPEAAKLARRTAWAAWKAANPDRAKAMRAKYKARHREAISAKAVAYRKTHPVPPINRRVSEARRRARKTEAGGSYTKDDVAALLANQNDKCAYCKKSVRNEYAVDHIIPVRLGGSSNPHNLQIVCRICNSSKGGKHPIDFARSRGLLV